MRYLFRTRIGSWRITLSVGRVTDVKGINSELKDGRHIIMWEFDETDWQLVKRSLMYVQTDRRLPTIYISRSHPGGGYHAYCLVAVPWIQSVHIVSGTPLVDPGYINMCAIRGHWTLRLTDKGMGAPEFWEELPSLRRETASTLDLKSYVKYEAFKSKRIFGWGKRGS